MKLSTICSLAVLPAAALTWSPFKHASDVEPAVTGNNQGRTMEVGSKFNPQELLETRKPEIYTEALSRLKCLEDEPICHRVAAQLLMNNCRGLDGINEQTYQLNSDHIQRHHVESFTASLTICEMERSALFVPEACSAFSSAALFQHARENKGKLEVSPEQVGDCMIALAHDTRGLTLWVSYRNSAMMFCRAARLDLEKDQHILLHRELANNMAKFSDAVHEDLELIRKKMADNARVAGSYLETFLNNANEWKSKLQQALQSVSKDAEDVDVAIDSIIKNSNTAAHMMKQLVQTIYTSTAEVSVQQEHALQVSTTNIETQIGNMGKMMGVTEEGLAILGAIISDRLNPMMISLSERQDALEEKSQAALTAVMNATEILQGHVQKLSEASRAASNINEKLEQAVENAHTWGDALSLSGSPPDWTLRTWIPVGVVAIGNFGYAASWVSNIQLGIAGMVISEVIIWTRHSAVWSSCQWGWNLITSSRIPSAVTHKAREGQPLMATPVQFNTPVASDVPYPHPEMVWFQA